MRKYNHNISEKANQSLAKRQTVVRRQKSLIAGLILLLVSLGILLGTGMRVMASAKKDPAAYNKYYKSVRIEYGDTLWSIADEYIEELNIDKTEYIAELCDLNHITADEIRAGEYIVVSYYSKEVR